MNIKDVVRANLLALEDSKMNYQVYNVGGGKDYTVLELAAIVGRALKKEVKNKASGKFRLGDTRHITSDISKLKALGWQPINSIQKSVDDYVAWVKEEGAIQDLVEFAQKKMENQGVVRKLD